MNKIQSQADKLQAINMILFGLGVCIYGVGGFIYGISSSRSIDYWGNEGDFNVAHMFLVWALAAAICFAFWIEKLIVDCLCNIVYGVVQANNKIESIMKAQLEDNGSVSQTVNTVQTSDNKVEEKLQ